MKRKSKCLLAALACAAGGSLSLAQVVVATDTPVTIFDLTSVSTTITINPGDLPGVSSLSTVHRLTHTWNSDLDVILVRGGKYLELSTDNGGSGDNWNNVRFIDSAANSATLMPTGGNVTGEFRPEGTTPTLRPASTIPLAGLTAATSFADLIAGETDGAGSWTLWIDDDAGGDVGVITYFSMEFNGVLDPTGPGGGGGPPGPANDNCAAAIDIVGPGVYAYDATNATNDGAATCGVSAASPDIWFRFTPPATATFRIETCGLAGNDTVLSALDGCGGLQLACNDDACARQSRIDVSATAGVPFLIRISTFAGLPGTTGAISITQRVSPPAFTGDFTATPNDLAFNVLTPGTSIFDPANPQPGISDGAGELARGTRYGALTFDMVGNEVAYRVTHAGGPARFTMSGLTDDLDLFLLDSFGQPAGLVAASPGFFGTAQERITVADLPAGTYYLVADTFSGTTDGGSFNILWDVPPPPPVNDECAAAIAIFEGDTLYDLTSATTDGTASCATSNGDVWYTYTPAVDGAVRIETCNSLAGDTVLSVYDSCFGVELACNDDSCGARSSVTVPVFANVPITIRLASFGAGNAGEGILTVTALPPPPANDLCANAAVVNEGDVISFDTSTATNDGTATCGASTTSPDIWYVLTPSISGSITIDTCGSAYDTVLSVLDACGGTQLICNDDSCGLQSSVTTCVQAGVPVHIRVSGFAGGVGSGTLSIGVVTPGVDYANPGGTPEGEDCGINNPDIVNGGCNSTPPVFGSIACGQTIVWTAQTSTTFRDTDWFQFTLETDTTVTLEGQAQFPAQMLLLSNVACPAATVLAFDRNSGACDPGLSITQFLTAGTYVAFMSASGFAADSCGDGNDEYWMRLSHDGCTACPCVADFDGSGGTPDGNDIDAYFSAWLAGDASADSDCSGGTPDGSDVETFFGQWLNGGCN